MSEDLYCITRAEIASMRSERDENEQLRARIKNLEVQLDRFKEQWLGAVGMWQALEIDRDRVASQAKELTAERDRLREALDAIGKVWDECGDGLQPIVEMCCNGHECACEGKPTNREYWDWVAIGAAIARARAGGVDA